MKSEEIFKLLAADSTRDRTSKYRRLVPRSNYDIFLEVDYPSGNRKLRIHGTPSSDISENTITAGFASTYSATEKLYQIELQQTILSSLFSEFIDNLLAFLSDSQTKLNPIDVLINRIKLWRRLFENTSNNGLSPEAQRGLFAELSILVNVLVPVLGPSSALESWKAPTRTSKDFVYQNIAVEVKSRINKAASKIRISSEWQLENAGYQLFLFVVSLNLESFDGISLPTLVDIARNKFKYSNVQLGTFNDSLIQVGYHAIHQSFYEAIKYDSSSTFYLIEDNFPRIVSQHLSPGINHVSYDIELASLENFVVDFDKFQQLLLNQNV